MGENKWRTIFRDIFYRDNNKSGVQKLIEVSEALKQEWGIETNKSEELKSILELTLILLEQVDNIAFQFRENLGDDIEKTVIDTYLDLLKETWGNLTEEEQRAQWKELTDKLESEILLSRVFSMTKGELKREKNQEVYERIKNNEYALEKYWESLTDIQQRQKWDEITNLYKNNERHLLRLWKSTKEKVRKVKIKEICSRIKGYYNIQRLWETLSKKEQEKAKNIIFSKQIIKDIIKQNDKHILKEMIQHSSPNIRREKIKIIFGNIPRTASDVGYFVEILTTREMRNNTNIIIETIKNELKRYGGVYIRGINDLGRFWTKIPQDIQIEIWPSVFKIIQENKGAIIDVFSNSSEPLKTKVAEKLFNLFPKDEEYKRYIWIYSNDNIKEKYLNIFLEAIENLRDFQEMWDATSEALQRKYWDVVMETIPFGNMKIKGEIWGATKLEIQREKWGEITKQGITKAIWAGTKPDIQEQKFKKASEKNWDDINNFIFIWGGLDENIQQKNEGTLDEILNKYQHDLEVIGAVWKATCSQLQEKKWEEILRKIEKNPDLAEIILTNTDSDIIKKNLTTVVKIIGKDIKLLGTVWKNCRWKQNLMWDEMYALVKEDPSRLCAIWKNTERNTQEKHEEVFQTLFDMFGNDENEVVDIWINTSNKIQEKNEDKLKEMIEQPSLSRKSASKIWNRNIYKTFKSYKCVPRTNEKNKTRYKSTRIKRKKKTRRKFTRKKS